MSKTKKNKKIGKNTIVSVNTGGQMTENYGKLVGITAEIPPIQPVSEVERPVEYAFPTKSRCPRCGVSDTIAVSTAKNIQYRKCRQGICRQTYKVVGTEL